MTDLIISQIIETTDKEGKPGKAIFVKIGQAYVTDGTIRGKLDAQATSTNFLIARPLPEDRDEERDTSPVLEGDRFKVTNGNGTTHGVGFPSSKTGGVRLMMNSFPLPTVVNGSPALVFVVEPAEKSDDSRTF